MTEAVETAAAPGALRGAAAEEDDRVAISVVAEVFLEDVARSRGNGRPVRGCPGIHAAQLAQVGGTLERVLQPLIGLVHAHCPLHRDALRRAALGGEAVRVHLGLQRAPALVEHRAVERLPRRQAEQREVGIGDVQRCVHRRLA